MQVTPWSSDNDREGAAEPVPGAVGDNVGRVGDQRSVVCDELARLVSSMVVVRVTDGRVGAVGHALHATIHLERARHFVDHPSSMAGRHIQPEQIASKRHSFIPAIRFNRLERRRN